jgi:hypothetical protein
MRRGADYALIPMRFILALKCFFLVLFAKRLPPEAAALLPPAPKPAGLPVQEAELVIATTQPMDKDTLAATAPVVIKAKTDDGVRGAVQLLSILQREGRLLDFLQEEIDAYPDAQIGAAVRDIHRGCKKALAEHVPLEPVLREAENATVRVDEGFDPARIRLTGNVMGEPPYTGTLKHHGWRTKTVNLPVLTGTADPLVVAPAEVELP